MANQKKDVETGVTSRLERILSFMAVGLISTAIITMIIVLAITLIHKNGPDAATALTLPPFFSVYIQLGLSVGALCIIGIVVSNIIRRSRSNR
jgi:TRAP-type C4-dicarboxylate transport system permease small subunit